MELHSLPKLTTKSKRRVGRGHGSGRSKTAGRGTKGQNARSKRPLSFEGGALSLIKRLPFLRGKGKNKVFKKKPLIVNVKYLNLLPANSTVDVAFLIKHHIVDQGQAEQYRIKILGEGELTTPLTIKLPVSKSAKKKIENAGGTV